MTEIMPFPENNYETVLLNRPFTGDLFGAGYGSRLHHCAAPVKPGGWQMPTGHLHFMGSSPGA